MNRKLSVLRRGVTLVEMMIAMIITLMIVFAMVQAFRTIGDSTTDGRAQIEMLGQIRMARVRLEDDFSRCTVPLAYRDPTVLKSEQYQGYEESIEGLGSDSNPQRYLVRTAGGLKYNSFNFADPNNVLAAQSQTLFGDLDDFLCMTVRNDDVPFRGRYAIAPGGDGAWGTADDVVNTIESNLAEVVWWVELNDQPQDFNNDGIITPANDANGNGVIDPGEVGEGGSGEWNPGETFTVHRRVLLIRPDLGVPDPTMSIPAFLFNNDISVHYHFDATTYAPMGLRTNSLGDLTLRCNRIAHAPINYSLSVVPGGGNPPAYPPLGLSTGYFMSPLDPSLLPGITSPAMRGEDVVLSNVLAFDFRVFDPNVPVYSYATQSGELPEGLVPGDPGYSAAAFAGVPQGYGGYVDLGAVDPSLSVANSNLYNQMLRNHNGIDDNNSGAPDEAIEALIDPPLFIGGMFQRAYQPFGNYVYDPWTSHYETDAYNQDGSLDGNNITDEGGETSPPYPFPLRAFQVRIRMYESDTRQVRQVSQSIKFAK